MAQSRVTIYMIGDNVRDVTVYQRTFEAQGCRGTNRDVDRVPKANLVTNIFSEKECANIDGGVYLG